MNATTLNPAPTYRYRPATPEDASAIAPLYLAFAKERAAVDRTIALKPDFNFHDYIACLLAKPLTYGWLLEAQQNIVGFLFIYFYDEAPPTQMPYDLIVQRDRETPFLPRRVGSVLGLYIDPEHRHPNTIKLLAEAGLALAEQMNVNDIDILVSAEQTGVHALLERFGFQKAAVQYVKHSQIPADAALPSLHPPHPEAELPELPLPQSIPLRHPETQELLRNDRGEPFFLNPLVDETGKTLLSSRGEPIYPTPVRDPQTNNWALDRAGELVLSPVLRDENGQIVECNGTAVFHPVAYSFANGEIRLRQDEKGAYLFCEVERDKDGKILRSPEGMPIFKLFYP